MGDYGKVGGARSDDQVRKSDLLAILPGRLQSDPLWKSTVPTGTYEQFRDQVLTQPARVVDLEERQGQRRGGADAVDGREEPQSQPPPLGASLREDAEEDERENPTSSREELPAMVNKARSNGGGRGAPRQRGPRGDSDRPRAPRKCANCSKEHEQRACPHPAVAVADRPCWICGEKGHSAKFCPDKRAGNGSVKAIEDALTVFGPIGAVTDNEGFTMARRTAMRTPRNAQLGDFMATTIKNSFNVIRNEEPVENRSQPAHSRSTVGSQPAGGQPDIDRLTPTWRGSSAFGLAAKFGFS